MRWNTWNNGPLRLYHGTDDVSAQSILATGIDLHRCSPFTDFGRGFYTTTHLTQAWSWANKRCQLSQSQPGLKPAVLQFDVDRELLGSLSNLFLTHEDDVRTGFWSLVNHCRRQVGPHIPRKNRNYSTVSGPVSLWPQSFVIKDCDQISFHAKVPAGRRIDPDVNDAVKDGSVLLVATSEVHVQESPPASSSLRRLVAETERALRRLGCDAVKVLADRVRRMQADDLALHFDPRQLACLLAGVVVPTAEQLSRLSTMTLKWAEEVPRPATDSKRGRFRASGEMDTGAS